MPGPITESVNRLSILQIRSSEKAWFQEQPWVAKNPTLNPWARLRDKQKERGMGKTMNQTKLSPSFKCHSLNCLLWNTWNTKRHRECYNEHPYTYPLPNSRKRKQPLPSRASSVRSLPTASLSLPPELIILALVFLVLVWCLFKKRKQRGGKKRKQTDSNVTKPAASGENGSARCGRGESI